MGLEGWEPPASLAPWRHARLLPRLVLPYVRHLKGEDDKPLPPSKPRKQYKMAKEPRGDDGATERPKKVKEERRVDQVSSKPRAIPLKAPLPAHCGCRAPCLEPPEHPSPPRAAPGRGGKGHRVVHYLRALKLGVHVGSES